jgi:hypothetical protein
MARPHGYYWVKFPADPQPQIVLIQEDGNLWVFGKNQPQRIPGDEPVSAKRRQFEIISGPLFPPEVPQTPEIRALGRP